MTDPVTPHATANKVTPDEVLARLGIKNRGTVALRNAFAWASVLSHVQKGVPDQIACEIAGVKYATWAKWLQWGRSGRPDQHGCESHGKRPDKGCVACMSIEHRPLKPYNELVIAHRKARSPWRAELYKNAVERAKMGDQRAMEWLLDSDSAQTRAKTLAAEGRLKRQLLKAQIKKAEAEASLALKRVSGDHVDRVEIKHLSEMSDEQLREEANRLLAELSAKSASSSAEPADDADEE